MRKFFSSNGFIALAVIAMIALSAGGFLSTYSAVAFLGSAIFVRLILRLV